MRPRCARARSRILWTRCSVADKRILLADDEETFLHSTADVLRENGYDCDCARDAQEALSFLAGGDYDLLITDINMPGNSELEFLNHLHQHGSLLPVIVITGYPSVQTAVGSFRLAALEYLQKPLEIDELLAHVERGLKRGHLFRTMRQTRRELHTLMEAMDHLEEAERQPGLHAVPSGVSVGFSAYLDQAVQHLATVATGLKRTLQALRERDGDAKGVPPLPELCPNCQRYREGLYHTVKVLLQTKGAFRSKELGELRRYAEALLRS
ncbi:MAG: response regulator [Nitrospirae bacterium]|nr:MAG: response regulator [Nitrospirota bacterium]